MDLSGEVLQTDGKLFSNFEITFKLLPEIIFFFKIAVLLIKIKNRKKIEIFNAFNGFRIQFY